MTRMKRIRLTVAMTVARWLGVPVDVHGTFFMEGKNSLSTSGRDNSPK
ncbi:hypothetical protein SAMN04488498_113107 [Mesorhizobium albiziae]|uniref:Uncharacterized protein n=1 Tax=Neomesorhizobium albiziae TaxID=335020 RepID=A0A1I4CKR4_9HYPH|nr:hypothetical protein SAMN04488498_113107 [Mesorhizobium albiziae]